MNTMKIFILFTFLLLSSCITTKTFQLPSAMVEIPKKTNQPSLNLQVQNSYEVTWGSFDFKAKPQTGVLIHFPVIERYLQIGAGSNGFNNYFKFEIPFTSVFQAKLPNWRFSLFSHYHFYQSESTSTLPMELLSLNNMGRGSDTGFSFGRELNSSTFLYAGISNLENRSILYDETSSNVWSKRDFNATESTISIGLTLGSENPLGFAINHSTLKWSGDQKTTKTFLTLDYQFK